MSFDVRRGEVVGVIGRNGSGKSTLLQIMAGILQPAAGEVRLWGRVGALLELGSGFNLDCTGRENVVLNAAILGMSRREIARRADEIVAFADIGSSSISRSGCTRAECSSVSPSPSRRASTPTCC